ncbi:hypothetical protein DSO57_1019564 [Entomophthora muscae]|uniref:Uncharacterized protein n=1 Tax=Entomophthora muscae TaxID=34485 RepID=A0ACC2RV48_9FUNG|nr:hypothetical protein DSO57_1019564 [Entomophthora muscae]
MKEIPTAPPLPNPPPAQDFSKLGVVYITVLGPASQVVPRTGSWRPLATAANHLVRIVLIVYMAFQAQPPSPVGAQLDLGIGRDTWGAAMPALNPATGANPAPRRGVNHPAQIC